MTWYEEIKNMSVDEMTEVFFRKMYPNGANGGFLPGIAYLEKQRIKQWLKSEVKK